MCKKRLTRKRVSLFYVYLPRCGLRYRKAEGESKPKERLLLRYFMVRLFCSTMVLYRNSTSSLPSKLRNRPTIWLERYRISTA